MADILLIDDNKELLSSLTLILKRLSHTPHPFSSAADAIAYLKENRVDLVLTDMLMPEEDGLDVIRHILMDKDLPDGLPVIAMSGGSETLSTTDALTLARSFGVETVLFKPFSKDELGAALDGVL